MATENLESCTKQNCATMDALVALCKRRGFIFNSSEIYGGIGGFFDYGPLGVELKNNIKFAWWQDMVHAREDIVGLDASIIMNSAIWKASGHVDGFCDPMVDCKESKLRYRADQLFFAPVQVDGQILGYVSVLEAKDMHEQAQKAAQLLKRKAACPGELQEIVLMSYTQALPEQYALIPSPATGKPGSLMAPRSFNLMFATHVGALQDASSTAYLRPETAQGIFVNFKNVTDSTRVKIPFGIAQIGKAFRNEITPRNFIFRSREFEQMEIEYFINPDDQTWPKLHREWIDIRLNWLESIGITRSLLQEKVHPQSDLAHYAKACTDIVFKFPFGWQELEGIAARGNYDLTQHQAASTKNLDFFDEARSQRYIPHVIEPSLGVERCLLAVLTSAYAEDEVDGEKRIFLKFHPRIAPIKAGIFPLVKNKPELMEKAQGLYKQLKRRWMVALDTSGAIGKRYRRMDEAGTPFCFTIDYQTLEDDTVTVRQRDSTQQSRLPLSKVAAFIEEAIYKY